MGALIRRARQAKGLSLESLASTLKVTPRQAGGAGVRPLHRTCLIWPLPRALAKTVCRYLEIDPAPVMATFPIGATRGPVCQRPQGRAFQGLQGPPETGRGGGCAMEAGVQAAVAGTHWHSGGCCCRLLLAPPRCRGWMNWRPACSHRPPWSSPLLRRSRPCLQTWPSSMHRPLRWPPARPTEPVAAQAPVPDASASVPLATEAVASGGIDGCASLSDGGLGHRASRVGRAHRQRLAPVGRPLMVSWVEVRDATGAKGVLSADGNG